MSLTDLDESNFLASELSCVFVAMREGLAEESILPEVLHKLIDDAPGCSIDSNSGVTNCH